ncbi:MAG: 3-dehydroquinate synthase [Verrucomicrobiota bacterium]|nr:3-dehydroquinate synthase [Verrucomicrobiota bacterium]
MRVVKVSLGQRSYEILIGHNLFSRLGQECKKRKLGDSGAIISDANVAPLYAKKISTVLQQSGFENFLIQVPAGETSKSLKTVQFCYDQLAKNRLERKSFVIALGGGVIGDLVGFVAATYLRGISFVQIPTTLLAQVDSSVGGKVGVNLRAGKNLVGSFYQPKIVLCDLATLKTLPEREFRAGLAEVIKYGIIYDEIFFKKLEKDLPQILQRDETILGEIIGRCCEIKADIVSQDETESGLRAILNFGHTIGHAIENSFGYRKFLHGEAISIGQIAAAKISHEMRGLSESGVERIQTLFSRAGLPTKIKLDSTQRRKFFAAMKLDKKVSAGEIRFVLAEKIGRVKWGEKVPIKLIENVLE